MYKRQDLHIDFHAFSFFGGQVRSDLLDQLRFHAPCPTGDVSVTGVACQVLPVSYTHLPSLYWGRGYDNGANSDNESDYKRFQAQVKVDFMFSVAKSFYIGPMAVFLSLIHI